MKPNLILLVAMILLGSCQKNSIDNPSVLDPVDTLGIAPVDTLVVKPDSLDIVQYLPKTVTLRSHSRLFITAFEWDEHGRLISFHDLDDQVTIDSIAYASPTSMIPTRLYTAYDRLNPTEPWTLTYQDGKFQQASISGWTKFFASYEPGRMDFTRMHDDDQIQFVQTTYYFEDRPQQPHLFGEYAPDVYGQLQQQVNNVFTPSDTLNPLYQPYLAHIIPQVTGMCWQVSLLLRHQYLPRSVTRNISGQSLYNPLVHYTYTIDSVGRLTSIEQFTMFDRWKEDVDLCTFEY